MFDAWPVLFKKKGNTSAAAAAVHFGIYLAVCLVFTLGQAVVVIIFSHFMAACPSASLAPASCFVCSRTSASSSADTYLLWLLVLRVDEMRSTAYMRYTKHTALWLWWRVEVVREGGLTINGGANAHTTTQPN